MPKYLRSKVIIARSHSAYSQLQAPGAIDDAIKLIKAILNKNIYSSTDMT